MSRRRQQGAVLLALLLVLMTTAAWGLSHCSRPELSRAIRAQHTSRALRQAREALIAWALFYPEQHRDMPVGYLPCPDLDGDGIAEGVCGRQGQNVIGRLPWRTLKLPPLRDGDGECLWYVVSGQFKNNPKLPLSSDSDGQLLIHADGAVMAGARPRDRAIALVLAPGPPLPGQNRRRTPGRRTACGSRLADPVNRAVNYLERVPQLNEGRADVPVARFQQGVPGDAVTNDRLLALTPADFRAVYRRMDQWVAKRVGGCLRRYALVNGGLLPWAAGVASGDFYDQPDQLQGRIANAIGNGSVDALQGLAHSVEARPALRPAWPSWPGSAACFHEAGNRAEHWWWWSAWKAMVFIAIDPGVAPVAGDQGPVRLDGRRQQAVVLVAGRRNADQHRGDRADIGQYLEAPNLNLSSGDFRRHAPGANDVVLGLRIRQTLIDEQGDSAAGAVP